MLDAFEARLIEVLTDALSEVSSLASVSRPRDGRADPAGDEVHLRVRLLDARPLSEVGDDEPARLRRGGEWRHRVELRLGGEVELAFHIGEANPQQRGEQRRRLIQTLDRALVVLADAATRAGAVFRTEDDRGFDLDGFRLVAIEAPPEPESDGGEGRRMIVRCRYAGRFWPVGEEQAGVAIEQLQIRELVLPIGLPSNSRVAAAAELEIPLQVELNALEVGGGPLPEPVIMARLAGTSPGELLGVPVPEASGWFAFTAEPGLPGRFVLRYRAPASVSGKAEARIRLSVARGQGARVDLGALVVEVHA